MGQHRSISLLRIAGIGIIGLAGYHFLMHWEWLPDQSGWGTGRLMVLLFWAAVCFLLDAILRRAVPDRTRLDLVQAVILAAVFGILLLSA